MKLLVSCPSGLWSLLASELKRLGEKPFGTFERGTWVETDLGGMYRINLHSRLANKVYIQLASSQVKNFDQLFEMVKKSDYGQRTNNANVSFKVTTHKSLLSASRAIQSVAHKALLDSIVNFSRNESWNEELLLLLENNQATLLLNTSGPSLHNRGYRTKAGLAPLKENLAAAMVLLSGRKFRSPLRDPFCGAGTIAIEALLLAKNIAPWSKRSFAFERFSCLDFKLWQQLKAQAEEKIFDGRYEIYASDIDPRMLEKAKSNLAIRGLEGQIKRIEQDFLIPRMNFQQWWILTNPPYWKRIGGDANLKAIYTQLAKAFVEGVNGGVITSFEGFLPDNKLFSEKKWFNGDEKCSFWYKKLG